MKTTIQQRHHSRIGRRLVLQTRGKIGIAPKLWTREDLRRLVETGVLEANQFELLDGRLLPKMAQHEPHQCCVVRVLGLLLTIFGTDYLRVGGSMLINETSEPEPDVAVTRNVSDIYVEQDEAPGPEEFLLAVEVSDSTLAKDRRLKAGLYARAGVPEYWILNVNARQLIVHRTPARGKYQSVVTLGETESVAPLAAPEKSLTVMRMLPKPRLVTGKAAQVD